MVLVLARIFVFAVETIFLPQSAMLQRIMEHDSTIQALSQREDRDQHLPAITEMLGLRGHMYGELMRIQMMLAKDDPSMKVTSSCFIFWAYI